VREREIGRERDQAVIRKLRRSSHRMRASDSLLAADSQAHLLLNLTPSRRTAAAIGPWKDQHSQGPEEERRGEERLGEQTSVAYQVSEAKM
jgi:hypothetical protein